LGKVALSKLFGKTDVLPKFGSSVPSAFTSSVLGFPRFIPLYYS